MEPLIDTVVCLSGLMVPVLALWAICSLYSQPSGNQCYAAQFLFFGTLLLISCVTIRTVIANDGCWLVHTASLGVMIVAGVMRRPADESLRFVSEPALRA